ncbi:hypothetical protein Syun_024721 [Stephania yunnanensis]|uniref:Pentatricopeptide repeat-containing protein n=1 Tax=Stephania yunnanensis TaxID=152371 RepID=A0AAP0EQS0_9MAGN
MKLDCFGLVQISPLRGDTLLIKVGVEHMRAKCYYFLENNNMHMAKTITRQMEVASIFAAPILCRNLKILNCLGFHGTCNLKIRKLGRERLPHVAQQLWGLLERYILFWKGGQLQLMENTLKEMVSNGFPVDSATGNAFLLYYSEFGSSSEMEAAYGRFKRSGFSIEEEGIRAVASAYIKEGKFYRLGEFLRGVGLGRKNVGNLLWNFLLLSYAANFKMKSMQREFLSMLEAGFSPDLTTFNIRALAFSRMALFWDLHVSLEHMKHDRVIPDLVTYGCVVDAFLDRKVGRNLDFALTRMNVDDSPLVSTDQLVFDVLGKGDFHSSSEAFLECNRQQKWTYRKLISVYLKKKYRCNQIFWNY